MLYNYTKFLINFLLEIQVIVGSVSHIVSLLTVVYELSGKWSVPLKDWLIDTTIMVMTISIKEKFKDVIVIVFTSVQINGEGEADASSAV